MLTRDELLDWDRQIVWHAFTQMAEYEPLIIERAKGCTLYDIDGRAYLDGISSLWCNMHGHRHPRIDAAIRAAVGQGRPRHESRLIESDDDRAGQAAGRSRSDGLGHVFFSDDGATAVEVALKMAFQYWRQRPIRGPRKRCTWRSTMPITATRWAASASAAWSVSTPCFARCCSK